MTVFLAVAAELALAVRRMSGNVIMRMVIVMVMAAAAISVVVVFLVIVMATAAICVMRMFLVSMRSTPDGRGGFFQGTALLLGNENIGLVGNRDFLHFRQKPVWVFGGETKLLGRVDDVGLADTRQGSDFALDF